ncbi:MAG: ParB/RepB/Spo0J family partition protein [Chloroflexi bacterium]|jgi:ParB family chromosome partitioning protein|uniref:Stage 0 sporulation protein J n=1 Tax=Candidatus Thermofonsia Clade 3 bacterium TaxID=2364212 RepID=A0A2M8QGU9_9CHLR|nr:ParB/RepB/Spo0J family partition protein [Candidatus Roseilinea sp. NK_OTU-006]PJF48994.1 MAG: stage 0 sporulation protein J [Candidatus Thermofonsia Clade 3 bacterium]RMG63424.1 MAG: ParB/RepB/Spo0J family partition protein [Chloroflexota bacterium]
MAPKTGLGRGLDALIPGASEAEAGRSGVIEIAVTEIRANPRQPRMVRGQEALQLEELAASIREHGVIQPLIVTRTQGPGAPYTLIAGERRWRAAQLAGLTHVPVVLKDATPQEMLEIALIENIQRNDLSPLEEAAAFQQLINEFGLTPDMVAERVGKSRVAIYNTLRLLKLPGQAQAALMQGDITEGHARALLGLSSAVDQLIALDEIKKHGLNVRQTEELIRRMNSPKTTSKKAARDREWQGAKEYESRLRDVLGTKVSLVRGRKGGRIVIEFYSDEELEAIFEKIVGSSD